MSESQWDELRVVAPQLVPFFERAERGRLSVPRCSECGVHRWPPRELCGYCHADRAEWVEIRARGTIYSWTSASAAEEAPLAWVIGVVTLDLPDLVRLVGRVQTSTVPKNLIGEVVVGRFEQVEGRLPRLVWSGEER